MNRPLAVLGAAAAVAAASLLIPLTTASAAANPLGSTSGFLVDPDAGFITAQVLTVDGGRMDYIGHGCGLHAGEAQQPPIVRNPQSRISARCDLPRRPDRQFQRLA